MISPSKNPSALAAAYLLLRARGEVIGLLARDLVVAREVVGGLAASCRRRSGPRPSGSGSARRSSNRTPCSRGRTALSALPITNGARLMLSTPPATNTSPSPQVIACAAIAIALSPRAAIALQHRARDLDRQPGDAAPRGARRSGCPRRPGWRSRRRRPRSCPAQSRSRATTLAMTSASMSSGRSARERAGMASERGCADRCTYRRRAWVDSSLNPAFPRARAPLSSARRQRQGLSF